MLKREGKQGSMRLMIWMVIAIFLVALLVIVSFFMLHKQEEVKISAALDTEYLTSDGTSTLEIAGEDTQSEETADDSSSVDQQTETEDTAGGNTQSDETEGDSFSADQQTEAEENAGTEEYEVQLIEGDEKSANRYERVTHLSYTNTVKYTEEELALLDYNGLKITRNEIYARHGRIFNDQELQEYFQRQSWYVPQTASNDFDESCLNDVESYNLKLIQSYEQQIGVS